MLYEVDSMIIITVSFVTFFLNWYNNRFLPMIRQFFLLPNRVNEFVDQFCTCICVISLKLCTFSN
jgi:hypothetical protein